MHKLEVTLIGNSLACAEIGKSMASPVHFGSGYQTVIANVDKGRELPKLIGLVSDKTWPRKSHKRFKVGQMRAP
jgi:hypothetical protein